MLSYPSIKNVWIRDPVTKYKTLIPEEWAREEFEYLKNNQWAWYEKVDGTNIRIMWDGKKVRYGGRTDRAQMPIVLFDKLCELFPPEAMEGAFGDQETEVCLYGEGYGAKIQKGGGLYIPDGVSFILFDVKIGTYWLRHVDVFDIATTLDIQTVPLVGEGTLLEAIEFVQATPASRIALVPMPMEGIVARPLVQLLDHGGIPIKTKIKCKDFEGI